MPIDIAKERVVSFREAARDLCPRRRHGRKPHVSTFYRWAARGLETIRVGGQLCTSVEALQRFFDRQTRTDNPRPVPKPMPADRNQVERELAALGL
ncbi:DUF1580 domain-containing protein [Fimbriiglobus ruber]|uniref:DUF1580 domain-containing protein n=1 Tax=Fimbriiglobus ruber TaxID=1908690 RepID=UPI000B4B975B|nr:DUF1580 domain-containing protein [Fimbriiglobus ruber]